MPHRVSRVTSRIIFIAVEFLCAADASGQETHDGHSAPDDSVTSGPVISAGAGGILLASIASPGVNNRTLAEGYLTQPMVMAMLKTSGGRFTADLTLNFEGSTLERG